jgi:hypothetical protein
MQKPAPVWPGRDLVTANSELGVNARTPGTFALRQFALPGGKGIIKQAPPKLLCSLSSHFTAISHKYNRRERSLLLSD